MKAVAIVFFLMLFACLAGAQVGGLFAEKFTSVDGVTVRRIRDTEEGVVCYVVVGTVASDYRQQLSASFGGHSPAIACLRVKP